MKLRNSLTKTIDDFAPTGKSISIYSCGPTVYNNLTIGNLSAFIYADLLRRVLTVTYPECTITHVMNVTDVDDKTIRDSKTAYPNEDPMQALLKFTRHYEEVFMGDMAKVGNNLQSYSFIRATESIQEMQDLIAKLYENNIAYLADDGVYFSIEAYQKTGKKYGQLVELEKSSDTKSRIHNDEYDKDSANDFALWKTAKPGEPSWEFTLGSQDVSGRPGWHIECSAMSHKLLGEQFDIHTGGVDLKFPHHENEIAQSTACTESPVMAKFFIHNDHMLVDGVKMSKSLGNFFTLRDVEEKGYDPLALRLLVLQGHYSNSVNFSWDNLEAAQNRLHNWKRVAALRWQSALPQKDVFDDVKPVLDLVSGISTVLKLDLKTPATLVYIDEYISNIERYLAEGMLDHDEITVIKPFFEFIDLALGLHITASTPILDESLSLKVLERKIAREKSDYEKSDSLRNELRTSGVEVYDSPSGQLWFYS